MPLTAGLYFSGYTPGEPLLTEPLVLIHGAGGSRLDWPLRRVPGRAVIAVDLPGHGAVSDEPGRASIADYAQAVLGLLGALNIPRAIFAGHSMGGAVSLSIALDQPSRAAGLILIASGARLRVHPSLLTDLNDNPEAAARQIATWSWSNQAPPDARAQMIKRLLAVPSQTLHDDFVACNLFDVRDQLAEIHIPALIIAGAEDQLTPVKYSIFLAERLVESRLHVIPDTGHMVMLEQPDTVSIQVTGWLAAADFNAKSDS